MTTLYGIPNCDTVKKARAWLTAQGVGYTFHDFKKQGVPKDRLAAWCKAAGWEKLLNRQGTSWRKLDADVQARTIDSASAQALMLAHASVIKRPVVEWGSDDAAFVTAVSVGFDAANWTELKGKQ